MGQGTLSQFITSLTLLLVTVESSFRHVIAHCRVVISLLVLVRVHSVEASYRHVSLSSRDLCRPPQTSNLYNRLSAPALKTIQLDQGSAAVLSIQANNGKVPFSKCDIKIKSSPGHGLMLRVETGLLRDNVQRPGKCTDYLQLGVDDNTPFITWNKSDKLCGHFTGFNYNDDQGELLIWLRLGEWDNLDTQESVHLSLVVTQYKTAADQNHLRACQTRQQWIRREYFCDGRVNCAMDLNPADENEEVCRGLKNSGEQPPSTSSHFPATPPLNLLSITLILVSATVILFIFCLLIVRLKKVTCFRQHRVSTPHSSSCELPETSHVSRARNINSSSGSHVLHHHNLTDLTSTSLLRSSTPDTEPPPAYNDLFPEGYKPSVEETDENHQHSRSQTSNDAKDIK